MKLYQIVAKDIMRRKRRVLYAALGVVIGTMTVVGILTIASAGEAKIYKQLEQYGPNLTVIPAINNLDMKLGDLSMGTLTVGENYIPEDQLPRIRQIADSKIREALKITDEGDIATIAPKLFANTKVNGISLVVVGVDPQQEKIVKTWWEVGKGTYLDGTDQALVGAIAADLLKLNVGDTVALNDSSVKVAGILKETGSGDDYQIFAPLSTVQKAFHKEGVISSLDIRALCNACPVEMIADSINQNIPGVRAIAVKQIAQSEMGLVEKMNSMMFALAGITLMVGLFGVVNTMMSSVHERTKDIGIMRAVGASRKQIIKIFIFEAVVIGIIGGIAGYLLGTALAYLIGPLVFEGTAVYFVPQYFPLALAVSIVVAVAAAVYPAMKAAEIRVADSFRSA
jgi:putative ABC transport system permease protein